MIIVVVFQLPHCESLRLQAEENRACLLAATRVHQLAHCCDPQPMSDARFAHFPSRDVNTFSGMDPAFLCRGGGGGGGIFKS